MKTVKMMVMTFMLTGVLTSQVLATTTGVAGVDGRNTGANTTGANTTGYPNGNTARTTAVDGNRGTDWGWLGLLGLAGLAGLGGKNKNDNRNKEPERS